jgi:hypothetical protein
VLHGRAGELTAAEENIDGLAGERGLSRKGSVDDAGGERTDAMRTPRARTSAATKRSSRISG